MEFFELFKTIIITLITLGILVTIHEFGHFWVARRCGIKVLRFSVGFGQPLFTWKDRLDTEYAIAWLPLGGYVKMLDEREAPVVDELKDQAFNNKSVSKRLATVVAGPLANFILAIVVYWVFFMNGVGGVVPQIDAVSPGSIAAKAGLPVDAQIVAVDDQQTPTWEALHFALLDRLGETGKIKLTLKHTDSTIEQDYYLGINNWLSKGEVTDLLGGLGIELYQPKIEPLVDKVVPSSPAEQAGLQAGDRVLSVDGVQVDEWQPWVDYVRARPEQTLAITFLRGADQLSTTITPAKHIDEEGQAFGQVGIYVKWPEWPEEMRNDYRYGVFDAAVAGVKRTWQMTVFTLDSLKKMIMGAISPKNLSGPITIAKVASQSASHGLSAYLNFLALLSVSLGVLNLLPIPVLDGGHILFYSIEGLIGRPVPLKVQEYAIQIGLLLIVSVMMLAIYNDIARL